MSFLKAGLFDFLNWMEANYEYEAGLYREKHTGQYLTASQMINDYLRQ